jgi:hypothetical protein
MAKKQSETKNKANPKQKTKTTQNKDVETTKVSEIKLKKNAFSFTEYETIDGPLVTCAIERRRNKAILIFLSIINSPRMVIPEDSENISEDNYDEFPEEIKPYTIEFKDIAPRIDNYIEEWYTRNMVLAADVKDREFKYSVVLDGVVVLSYDGSVFTFGEESVIVTEDIFEVTSSTIASRHESLNRIQELIKNVGEMPSPQKSLEARLWTKSIPEKLEAIQKCHNTEYDEDDTGY